jgi:hypothetical protein
MLKDLPTTSNSQPLLRTRISQLPLSGKNLAVPLHVLDFQPPLMFDGETFHGFDVTCFWRLLSRSGLSGNPTILSRCTKL